ncbi:hypothetical protein Agub_g12531, partial [Astrephomene gubernaculifera]
MEAHSRAHSTSSNKESACGGCNCLKRAKAEVLVACRIVRLHPLYTLVPPLLVLGVILAVGIWGVRHVHTSQESSSRDHAAILALDAASWVSGQLAAALAPLELAAAMVAFDPQLGQLGPLFRGLAPIMLARTPPNTTLQLQLAPHGVVREVVPLRGNETALGLDLFASASDRAGAVRAVADNTTTLVGPMAFLQGGAGVVARQPIFIAGVEAGETFGIADPISPGCGSPCEYNASTRTALWGFASALVDLSSICSPSSRKLVWLEGLGYRYEVAVLGGTGAEGGGDTRLVAASAVRPSDPVEAPIHLPNTQWVIRVSPAQGWSPRWVGGLLAGVVVLAAATAGALLAALLSRLRHQMLLEALLPHQLVVDLRGREDTSNLAYGAAAAGGGGGGGGGGRGIQQAETPADVLLRMMGQLLAGCAPELADVVLIRTALLRNLDLYHPLNVKGHIGGANLDAEVAQALMQQLVGGRRTSTTTAAPGGTAADEHNHPPSAFAAGIPTTTSSSAAAALASASAAGAAAFDLETLAGAIAFLVSPESGAPLPSAVSAVSVCTATGTAAGGGGMDGGFGALALSPTAAAAATSAGAAAAGAAGGPFIGRAGSLSDAAGPASGGGGGGGGGWSGAAAAAVGRSAPLPVLLRGAATVPAFISCLDYVEVEGEGEGGGTGVITVASSRMLEEGGPGGGGGMGLGSRGGVGGGSGGGASAGFVPPAVLAGGGSTGAAGGLRGGGGGGGLSAGGGGGAAASAGQSCPGCASGGLAVSAPPCAGGGGGGINSKQQQQHKPVSVLRRLRGREAAAMTGPVVLGGG